MWVMTRSDWPVLVNLERATQIGYHQIAKFDPRTQVVASAGEAEYTLAECADGDQARVLIAVIAEALLDGEQLVDLRDVDLAELTAESGAAPR